MVRVLGWYAVLQKQSLALVFMFLQSKVMRGLDHNNIIKYYDSFIDNHQTLVIVMEYAPGGDLAQKIRNQNGYAAPQLQHH